MKILRTIAAVVVGYVLFAVSTMLLVGTVMTQQGLLIVIVALTALALIGLVAGLVARAERLPVLSWLGWLPWQR